MIKLSNEYVNLKENEVLLVAGKPGVGKTRFVVNEIKNSSYENKVLYFSIENSYETLMEKYTLSQSENLIVKESNNIDGIIATINEIDPDYIYIDYLQLVKGENVIEKLKNTNKPVMVISMVPSQSDYSEYKTEEYKDVDKIMILKDSGLTGLE